MVLTSGAGGGGRMHDGMGGWMDAGLGIIYWGVVCMERVKGYIERVGYIEGTGYIEGRIHGGCRIHGGGRIHGGCRIHGGGRSCRIHGGCRIQWRE